MKIPQQAKKVFTGEIFEVYQWPQEMYDGSIATFEMLKRPNTLQIIPTIGDKIFLAQEEQPTKEKKITLLGGRQEQDEDEISGAKRELLEESGLSSDNWEQYAMFSPIHKVDWDIYYYVARNCKKVARQKLDSGEKIKILSVSFNDFIDIILSSQYWGDNFVLKITQLKLQNKLDDLKNFIFK